MSSRLRNGTTARSAARQLALALAFTAVALVAYALNAAVAIVAHLENPTSAHLASGVANVQGWAFPTTPGDEIQPQIDVYIDRSASVSPGPRS